MAILRNPNRGKFTVVDNYALRDDNLSLKARGLSYALGHRPCRSDAPPAKGRRAAGGGVVHG